MLGPNSDRYLELYVGAPAAGLVVMPLNTRHAEPELKYQLEDAGARLLLCAGEPGGLHHCVERVVDLDAEWPGLLAAAPEAELGRDVTPASIVGLFYTGGTTGASKGVVLTHGNLVANAWHMLVGAAMGADDVYLVTAPMFHAAGTVAVLSSLWLGAAQVILPAFEPRGRARPRRLRAHHADARRAHDGRRPQRGAEGPPA